MGHSTNEAVWGNMAYSSQEEGAGRGYIRFQGRYGMIQSRYEKRLAFSPA